MDNQNNEVRIENKVDEKNEVLEENKNTPQKSNKKNKKQKKIAMATTFIIVLITVLVGSEFIDNKKTDKIVVPVPTITPPKRNEIKTIEYNGYEIAYLSGYDAIVEENMLVIKNTNLCFFVKIHPNITKELYEPMKDSLKQELLATNGKINKEEKTIRQGIEFDLLKITQIVEGEEEKFEYFLTTRNDDLYEILVYEINNSNYAKISNQLKAIVKNTKKINKEDK